MKKFIKLILLFIILTLLTTYTSKTIKDALNQSKFFEIKKIEILKNNLITKNVIYNKLNKIKGRNIFLIKNSDIEKLLIEINFFNKVKIRKKYPDTIILNIFETKPLAILIKKKKKYLIDNKSNLIDLNKNINTTDLPTVFGESAEMYFLNFYDDLKKNDFLTDKIQNFYYFQIGRWDIQLLNGQLIKFPSINIVESIRQIVKLLNRKDMKKYNVIDLRIKNKVVVE